MRRHKTSVGVVLIVLAAAIGCACRSATDSGKPLYAPGREVWEVNVAAPPDSEDYNFYQLVGASSTGGEHPTIEIGGGMIATDRPEAIVTRYRSCGDLNADDPKTKATRLGTRSGHCYEIPFSSVDRDAAWYEVNHGLIAIEHKADTLRITRFDGGKNTALWSSTVAMPTVKVAAVVGELDNGNALLRADPGDVSFLDDSAPDYSMLFEVNIEDGAARKIAKLRYQAKVVVSEFSNSFVAVTFNNHGCLACRRLELRKLTTGELTKVIDLPVPVSHEAPVSLKLSTTDTDPHGSFRMGFDGRLIWMYGYRNPPPNHSMFPMPAVREKCGYEVYDSVKGERIRTLENATGLWKQLTTDCNVRALMPTSDGGVIAFVVTGVRTAQVVKFDHPP